MTVIKRKGPGGHEEEVHTHASYAMIAFHRMSGSSRRLFGSSLRENYSTVRISISPGQLIRDDYHDRYHGSLGGELIEIELSNAQFAEVLVSMNQGSGIPCTVRRYDGRSIESPPDLTTEVEHIKTDFDATLKGQVARTREYRERIDAALDKVKVSQKAREEIRIALDVMEQALTSNIPYVLERFNEATTKVVNAAKHEIDGFAQHALGPKAPQLAEAAFSELTPTLPPGEGER